MSFWRNFNIILTNSKQFNLHSLVILCLLCLQYLVKNLEPPKIEGIRFKNLLGKYGHCTPSPRYDDTASNLCRTF